MHEFGHFRRARRKPAATPARPTAGRFWLTFHLPRRSVISSPMMPLICAAMKGAGASATCHSRGWRPFSWVRVSSSIWPAIQTRSSTTRALRTFRSAGLRDGCACFVFPAGVMVRRIKGQRSRGTRAAFVHSPS
jgi:hypothetical protein